MSRKDYKQSDKMKTCPDCGGPAIFCHAGCKKANQKTKKGTKRKRRLGLAPWEKQLLKNSAAVILWDYRWTADKIATVLNLTLTQTRTLVLAYDNLPEETSEQSRKIKANELLVERLRKFFDGPNFVQADLTRDTFYKLLTDSKLEANGHKEQTK